MFVARFGVDGDARVASSDVLSMVCPPKRIVRADWASYAIPCLDRADGCSAGVRFVHVFHETSYPHVPLEYVPSLKVPTQPPNRIVRRDPLSYAARKSCWASGCPTGCKFVHVFDSKSYAHVSLLPSSLPSKPP